MSRQLLISLDAYALGDVVGVPTITDITLTGPCGSASLLLGDPAPTNTSWSISDGILTTYLWYDAAHEEYYSSTDILVNLPMVFDTCSPTSITVAADFSGVSGADEVEVALYALGYRSDGSEVFSGVLGEVIYVTPDSAFASSDIGPIPQPPQPPGEVEYKLVFRGLVPWNLGGYPRLGNAVFSGPCGAGEGMQHATGASPIPWAVIDDILTYSGTPPDDVLAFESEVHGNLPGEVSACDPTSLTVSVLEGVSINTYTEHVEIDVYLRRSSGVDWSLVGSGAVPTETWIYKPRQVTIALEPAPYDAPPLFWTNHRNTFETIGRAA